MKQQIAGAVVDKLEKDDRVAHAEIKYNDKGLFVEARCADRMSARSLRGDLGEYPVYVKVVA